MLNVHLAGTLVQDIASERPGALRHGNTDLPAGAKSGYAMHAVMIEPESRLGGLAAGGEGQVNSSHHQAIDRPGEGLQVTALAPDGMIEGVEWGSDSNWVVGVQWHPERMVGDRFAERLFAEFIAMARVFRGVLPQEGRRAR
jgi:putative glutamine amidotransferase